jgi:hypothetical protein
MGPAHHRLHHSTVIEEAGNFAAAIKPPPEDRPTSFTPEKVRPLGGPFLLECRSAPVPQ